MDLIGQIRRAFFEQRRAIKEISRELQVSRATVRKVVRSDKTAFTYAREVQPAPKLGEWIATPDGDPGGGSGAVEAGTAVDAAAVRGVARPRL